MDATSLSLLQRVQSDTGSEEWQRLLNLYQPLISGWLRQRSTPAHDADDLTQEVLAVVVRELPRFSHSGQTGAFRAWLRAITANRLRAYWRSGKGKHNMDVQNLADQLEDPNSELSQQWDRQHDLHVLRKLVDTVEAEFERNTILAFKGVTLEDRKAEQIASELGISTVAVYIAKSRVLKRLKELAQGLID